MSSMTSGPQTPGQRWTARVHPYQDNEVLQVGHQDLPAKGG